MKTSALSIIIVLLFSISSCNRSLNIEKLSIENDLEFTPLTVKGQFDNIEESNVPDHIKSLALSVKNIEYLGPDYCEIFYKQSWDGGDGIYYAIVNLFTNENFYSYKIEYEYIERKINIRNIKTNIIQDEISERIRYLFNKIESNGPWTLQIECDSGTTEQFLNFYLKRNNEYSHYYDFNNHHFTLNPSLNIDSDMIELVYLIEKINNSE